METESAHPRGSRAPRNPPGSLPGGTRPAQPTRAEAHPGDAAQPTRAAGAPRGQHARPARAASLTARARRARCRRHTGHTDVTVRPAAEWVCRFTWAYGQEKRPTYTNPV